MQDDVDHSTEAGGMIAHRPSGALVAPVEQARSVFDLIQIAMTDDRIDAGKLRTLLDIQADQEARQAERDFSAALHAAQAEMPRVSKDGTIKLGEGKGAIPFATWENVDRALRPIMERHGFSLSFDMTAAEGGVSVVITGTLRHVGGHSKTASMPLPKDAGPGRNAVQAVGSTLSYGKRYVAEMLFNIVRGGQDDDGDMGGRTYITAAQKDELVALMQEVGQDVKRFLEHFQIEALDGMQARQFAQAKNGLIAKRNKAKGGN